MKANIPEIEVVQRPSATKKCQVLALSKRKSQWKLKLECKHSEILLVLQGSLHDFIRQREKLDEQLTREFTQQILEGVDYLHSNEITHRDIKGRINLSSPAQRTSIFSLEIVGRVNENINPRSSVLFVMNTTPFFLSRLCHWLKNHFFYVFTRPRLFKRWILLSTG